MTVEARTGTREQAFDGRAVEVKGTANRKIKHEPIGNPFMAREHTKIKDTLKLVSIKALGCTNTGVSIQFGERANVPTLTCVSEITAVFTRCGYSANTLI